MRDFPPGPRTSIGRSIQTKPASGKAAPTRRAMPKLPLHPALPATPTLSAAKAPPKSKPTATRAIGTTRATAGQSVSPEPPTLPVSTSKAGIAPRLLSMLAPQAAKPLGAPPKASSTAVPVAKASAMMATAASIGLTMLSKSQTGSNPLPNPKCTSSQARLQLPQKSKAPPTAQANTTDLRKPPPLADPSGNPSAPKLSETTQTTATTTTTTTTKPAAKAKAKAKGLAKAQVKSKAKPTAKSKVKGQIKGKAKRQAKSNAKRQAKEAKESEKGPAKGQQEGAAKGKETGQEQTTAKLQDSNSTTYEPGIGEAVAGPGKRNWDKRIPKLSGPAIEPEPLDVLFGRGKPYQKHPGNFKLHMYTNRFKSQYVNFKETVSEKNKAACAEQAEKSKETRTEQTDTDTDTGDTKGFHSKQAIVDEIIRLVRATGGRFLKYNEEGQIWQAVTKTEARMKVAHVLRGKPRKLPDIDPMSLESPFVKSSRAIAITRDAAILDMQRRITKSSQRENEHPPVPVNPDPNQLRRPQPQQTSFIYPNSNRGAAVRAGQPVLQNNMATRRTSGVATTAQRQETGRQPLAASIRASAPLAAAGTHGAHVAHVAQPSPYRAHPQSHPHAHPLLQPHPHPHSHPLVQQHPHHHLLHPHPHPYAAHIPNGTVGQPHAYYIMQQARAHHPVGQVPVQNVARSSHRQPQAAASQVGQKVNQSEPRNATLHPTHVVAKTTAGAGTGKGMGVSCASAGKLTAQSVSPGAQRFMHNASANAHQHALRTSARLAQPSTFPTAAATATATARPVTREVRQEAESSPAVPVARGSGQPLKEPATGTARAPASTMSASGRAQLESAKTSNQVKAGKAAVPPDDPSQAELIHRSSTSAQPQRRADGNDRPQTAVARVPPTLAATTATPAMPKRTSPPTSASKDERGSSSLLPAPGAGGAGSAGAGASKLSNAASGTMGVQRGSAVSAQTSSRTAATATNATIPAAQSYAARGKAIAPPTAIMPRTATATPPLPLMHPMGMHPGALPEHARYLHPSYPHAPMHPGMYNLPDAAAGAAMYDPVLFPHLHNPAIVAATIDAFHRSREHDGHIIAALLKERDELIEKLRVAESRIPAANATSNGYALLDTQAMGDTALPDVPPSSAAVFQGGYESSSSRSCDGESDREDESSRGSHSSSNSSCSSSRKSSHSWSSRSRSSSLGVPTNGANMKQSASEDGNEASTGTKRTIADIGTIACRTRGKQQANVHGGKKRPRVTKQNDASGSVSRNGNDNGSDDGSDDGNGNDNGGETIDETNSSE